MVKGKRKSSVSIGDNPFPDIPVALTPIAQSLDMSNKPEQVSKSESY
jgi:hypothetical protein